MASPKVLMIIGPGDVPLYQADFSTSQSNEKREDMSHLPQFVIHAALDMVDPLEWQTNQTYLRTVDRFNEWSVSAYVTAGHVRLMLLHKLKNEENIKNFFIEVHELYIKSLLNPLHEVYGVLASPAFDAKVRLHAQKYLRS
eukprot:Platyproteum_vivax@DN5694_c0_g1_i2.p1